MRGNVTIDPLARALAVEKPLIEEVIDLQTGEVLKAADFIFRYRYGDLVRMRHRLKDAVVSDIPECICALCHGPCLLVASWQKRFFFRHHIDGDCVRTRSSLTPDQIKALKYHGQRESEAHKSAKGQILRSLLADPAFASVDTERVWKSSADPKAFRRADIQAQFGDIRLVFEVQLSTTFLDVVLGRRRFYRQEGALLVWVMRSFSPEYRRLTTDDMLFSNNSNLIVVDDETTALSEQSHEFHVRVHYRTAYRDGPAVAGDWAEELLPFRLLTLDSQRQWAFRYDYEAAESRVLDEIDGDTQLQADQLRSAFLERWRVSGDLYRSRFEHDEVWKDLRDRMEAFGIFLPKTLDRKVDALLNTIISLMDGQPFGWKRNKLVEIGHHMAENHPDLIVAYGHAVNFFGRNAQIDAEDNSGKWRTRAAAIRTSLKRGQREFVPNQEILPLIDFLLPEVGKKVRSLVVRQNQTPTVGQ